MRSTSSAHVGGLGVVAGMWSVSLLLMVTTFILVMTTMPSIPMVLSLSTSSNDDTYLAAAVQYSPVTSPTAPADQTLQANLNGLELLVASSSRQGAQIVVLNEGSSGMYSALARGRNAMLSFCEVIINNTLPCDNHDSTQQVRGFSCMARRYNIVIIAHMCDVVTCVPGSGTPTCPDDGRFQYNTQVVFNEHGTIIAKYHKSHLFGETNALDQPLPMPVWFDTSFGIRFGLLICFDIEFDEPARSLLKMGLRHFVYSASWWNYSPAFIATQFQQGFSRITSTNLIAANTGNSPTSFGGGLYSSGEPVNVYFNTSEFALRTVLLARLPVNPPQRVSHASQASISHVLPSSNTKPNVLPCRLNDMSGNCFLFDPSNTSTVSDASVSHNGIECSGQMMATNGTPGETFALMAFKGARTFNYTIDKLQTEMCLFLRCSYDSRQPQPLACRPLKSSLSTWRYLSIKAQHLSPQLTTLPFYAIDDGQVRPTSELGMKTSDNGATVEVWTNKMSSTVVYSVAVYNVGKPPSESSSPKSDHIMPPLMAIA